MSRLFFTPHQMDAHFGWVSSYTINYPTIFFANHQLYCLTIVFLVTGNLKHKDLYGQVVSSQVYANGDEDEAEAVVEADMEDRVLEEQDDDN